MWNKVTLEVSKVKSKYYITLFVEVKDCKLYWKFVKEVVYCKIFVLIMAIKGFDGKIEILDFVKANIMNKYFVIVGEKLVISFFLVGCFYFLVNISRVIFTIM